MNIGTRVTITGGMSDFVGKTGRVVGTENYGGGRSQTYYRVRLDEPVMVTGVGVVKDDLWQKSFLKSLR